MKKYSREGLAQLVAQGVVGGVADAQHVDTALAQGGDEVEELRGEVGGDEDDVHGRAGTIARPGTLPTSWPGSG